MDVDIDKDTDEFCNALLNEISELNRQLSKQLTIRLSNNPKIKDDKILRKLGKISIIYMEHYSLYERAAENLRSLPEWRPAFPDSTVSTVYRSVYKFISDIRYPGSVESKHEKQW